MKKSIVISGIALFAVATLVRLIYISTTMVVDDESYYYMWTRHLAGGYIDGGPTIAYVMKLFVALFGANGFSVRIGSVMLVSVATIYLFFWGKRRFGAPTGWLLGLLLTVTPIVFISSVVHTYDTEMVVCMLAAIALYHDAYFVHPRHFYLAGVMLGLALLSKISVLFPAVAIALMPLLVKEVRGSLRRKEYYLSFLIAALIFLPFIIWNLTHDMAFVRFKGTMAFRPGSFHAFVDVWAEQAAIYLPILFWFALVLPFRTVIARIRHRDTSAQDMYFALVGVFPIVYFGVGSLFSEYYGNWVAPAFLGGLFLTAISFGRQWQKYRALTVTHVVLSVVLLTVSIGQIYFDFLPIAPKADKTKRHYIYSAIPRELKGYLAQHPELGNVRIVGNDYQVASMVNLYANPAIEATGLSLCGYHDTMYTMIHPRQSLAGQRLLFLYPDEELPAGIRAHFTTVKKLQTFISHRHGREIYRLTLWDVANYDGRP